MAGGFLKFFFLFRRAAKSIEGNLKLMRRVINSLSAWLCVRLSARLSEVLNFVMLFDVRCNFAGRIKETFFY